MASSGASIGQPAETAAPQSVIKSHMDLQDKRLDFKSSVRPDLDRVFQWFDNTSAYQEEIKQDDQ